ncbi:snurportin-1 [Anastrepha obliqua]|uniref:snurportin-1 n=1 Tax=Anastrepha obliqua TaxID=95512 RepID=UPI00240952FF|nr:snurportin-1 [Anastrepha obliqua]
MFRDLYKKCGKNLRDLQEERRRKLLEEQKQKRLILQDLQRDVDYSENGIEGKYHPCAGKRGNSRALKDAYDADYTLQLSEWLRECPENLSEWIMVPCPKGQRCFLMATGGCTYMYSKKGRRRLSFHTLLPGGNELRGSKMRTLIDCVYSPDQDTFYVLDVIIYGNQEFVHCESQFRFFWLRSKFDECEGIDQRNRCNEKPLKLLERYDFENIADVAEVLLRFPIWPENEPALDGWLFYHKESSYTCGSTPLVGWLFPFMIPDVLGIPVNENYQRPANYTEPLAYMDEFDAELASKRKKLGNKYFNSTDMDTLESIGNYEDEETNAGFEAEQKLDVDEFDKQFSTCDDKLID